MRYLLLFLFVIVNNLFCGNIFYEKLNLVPLNDRVAVYNVKYTEIKANYDRFLSPEIVSLAKECLHKNKKYLKRAEKLYDVNRKVVVAILTVESLCGKYHEKYFVSEVYKTLIKLGKDKKYQRKIYKIVKQKYPKTTKKWFTYRVKKKSKWATIQMKALKKMYYEYKINVFNLKGSWAGAFGYPQFIPTTFLNYAVDGDNDKKINLNDFPDSIFSIANYLKQNGWKKNLNYKEKYKVILRYNYSKLYANTILKLADKL